MTEDETIEQRTAWEEQTPLIQDPEAIFNLVKRFTGVMTGFILIAVAISFGMHYVREEDVIRVFISVMIGWSGYLFSHYMATGKFIHQRQHQHLLPSDPKKILGGIYGILMIAAGIAIWAVSINQNDLIAMILGMYLSLLGYLIAHYDFTGDLL